MRINFKRPLYIFILISVLYFLFFSSRDTCIAIGQGPLEEEDISSQERLMAERIFSLGMNHYRQGEHEEAASAFRAALSLDNKNEEIRKHLRLAQYYKNNGRFEEGMAKGTPLSTSIRSILP